MTSDTRLCGQTALVWFEVDTQGVHFRCANHDVATGDHRGTMTCDFVEIPVSENERESNVICATCEIPRGDFAWTMTHSTKFGPALWHGKHMRFRVHVGKEEDLRSDAWRRDASLALKLLSEAHANQYGGSGADSDALMTLRREGQGSPVSPSREATLGESPSGMTETESREGFPASVSDDPDGTCQESVQFRPAAELADVATLRHRLEPRRKDGDYLTWNIAYEALCLAARYAGERDEMRKQRDDIDATYLATQQEVVRLKADIAHTPPPDAVEPPCRRCAHLREHHLYPRGCGGHWSEKATCPCRAYVAPAKKEGA